MDENVDVSIIVKFAVVMLIGIVLLVAVTGVGGSGYGGYATITFQNQPLDGEIVTLDSHVFEFDNNGSVASGHIAVTIGTTLAATTNNFRNAAASYYTVM